MEDSDFLCPLCCEELDISDRNFYPCKCGYQVCMWCWHRIRESESGLCPACRTPYGDDPHEFSAVDVEEVLKANREKEKAEKATAGSSSQDSTSSDTDSRTSLANMRVIRRDLVYAVGLPPLPEEVLKKPEYFGQYGKIAKMVVNRNNPPAGDARRASASAYVTFVHKEDTLACILALDGFFCEGRNVRASYGTSKYCSAFIKNVRCNNPECTYLHTMGEKEDTFTKQEIQAGYVTSGRDVLERTAIPGARRKVGGGGPSGTGKACPNPVFPPPSYEEAPKPLLVPRASTTKRSQSLGETAAPTKSAASVVAGIHATEPAATRSTASTLTSLTPLKSRSASVSAIGATKPKLEGGMRKSAPPASIGGFVIAGSGTNTGGVLSSLGGEVYLDEVETAVAPIGSGLLNSAPGGGGGVIGPAKKKSVSPIGGGAIGGNALGGTAIGGRAIGGSAIGGGYSDVNGNSTGSSALASMLGINLPSGSGSLSNEGVVGGTLWQGGGATVGGSTIGGAPIGSSALHSNGSYSLGNPIGGTAIGAIGANRNAPVGGTVIGGGKQNDIALLQSLLPGVHITSGQGGDSSGYGLADANWNSGSGQRDTWSASGGFSAAPGSGVIGAAKQQTQQNRNNIW